MIQILLLITLFLVYQYWKTTSAVRRCLDTNRKGEFHHYVTSGEYMRDKRKQRRKALKVKEKRNTKGYRR